VVVPGGAFFRCVGWALFKVTVLGYCFLVGEGHWSQFRLSFDDITLLFKETCCSFSPSIIPSLPYPNPILPETPPILQPPPNTHNRFTNHSHNHPIMFPYSLHPPLPLTHLKHQKNANPRKRRKQPLLQPTPPPPRRRLPRHPFSGNRDKQARRQTCGYCGASCLHVAREGGGCVGCRWGGGGDEGGWLVGGL